MVITPSDIEQEKKIISRHRETTMEKLCFGVLFACLREYSQRKWNSWVPFSGTLFFWLVLMLFWSKSKIRASNIDWLVLPKCDDSSIEQFLAPVFEVHRIVSTSDLMDVPRSNALLWTTCTKMKFLIKLKHDHLHKLKSEFATCITVTMQWHDLWHCWNRRF